MSRRRDRQRAEERQRCRERIITALTAAFPGLAESAAADALTAIRADRGIALRTLDEYLARHPDALTSADPRCPAVFVRLVKVLQKIGRTDVVLLGCSGCGRTDIDLPRFGPSGRLCQACSARGNKKPCSRCGRIARIMARRDGGGICPACYRVDAQVVEECTACGRVRRPATRRPDGKVLCASCWTPPTYTCTSCGRVGPAKVLNTDGALCQSCYRRLRQPRRACGKCGKVRVISRRATADSPDLCENCNVPPPGECSVCHQVKLGSNNAEYGFVCRACRPHKTSPCALCGQVRRVNAYWPLGPVCPSCYNRVLGHPEQCGCCGSSQPLIARGDDGEAICGPCAGLPGAYICPGCGTGGRLFADGRCPRCVLKVRLEQHLAGPDGHIPAQLRPLAEALAAADDAWGVLSWLRRSPNARLLAELAADGRIISHELLDELPPGRHERYVRQTLVHTGILPERDEDLDRIPAWLNTVLADRPIQHARFVRPYVHWFLLRRARRRATQRRHPARSGSFLRTRIRIALELLAWLDEHNLSLETLTQHDLDRWLAAGNTRNYAIRYFLGWAADRGLARRLTIPAIPRQDPARVLDENDRWDQLQRCLTDTELPLDVRVAGALLLLFGLPTSRIRPLRPEHLHTDDGATYLTIGRHPLLIPPKLAALLDELATAPANRTRLAAGTGWLFPGRVPGQPASPSGFSRKLLEHGIEARPARNAALIALVEDLPAPILADVLGLHINTADRWAQVAKRDWTDYLIAREEDLDSNR